MLWGYYTHIDALWKFLYPRKKKIDRILVA
jgi:hypothetical protein